MAAPPAPGVPAAVDWLPTWDVLGRIAVAAVLGTIIGFEREHDGHPAGTRTIATVAVGAALFGAISTRGFDDLIARRADTNVQIDVTRVASQVVVGIGSRPAAGGEMLRAARDMAFSQPAVPLAGVVDDPLRIAPPAAAAQGVLGSGEMVEIEHRPEVQIAS